MKCSVPAVGQRHLLAASLLALPLALWAQASAPLPAPLPTQLPTSLPTPLPEADWKKANAAVAEFPRGHADVLKWEQQNLPAAAAQAPSTESAGVVGSGRVAGAATQADGLSLMSPEAAVRQAWRQHRGLTSVMSRLGQANVHALAQGRWTEVDASLQRRVHDMGELLEVAAQGRKAWVQAVAARQVLQQRRTALEAAEAANELGRRMVSVGNWSKLQQTQVQLAQSNARMGLRRAQYAAAQAEAALIQTLGLTGQQATVQLPDRLPDLPAQTLTAQQLDARAAAIAGQLPRIEGQRNAALVRQARQAYTDSHALALAARDEVVQTRELISEETLLRYNGMLKSVWDVLAEVGNQSQAVEAAIEAQRDFWLAEADVQWVLQGGAPTSFVNLGGGGGGEAAAPAGH